MRLPAPDAEVLDHETATVRRYPVSNRPCVSTKPHPNETVSGEQMSADWDEVSYVISSSYRVKVLQRLAESPATPSRIAEETDCPIAHISRALRGLRERELVDLLVSEDQQKGRVYGITERGERIWETIEAQNLA